MSKRDNRRVVLSDFKDKKMREGSVEIQTDDGSVYIVPPPELWPDDAPTNNVDLGQALLGDQWAAFVASGGTANLLMAVLSDYHGLGVGESSASSGS